MPKGLDRSVLSSDGFNCKNQEMDGASDACYDSMRDKTVERSSGFCRGGTRTTRTVIGGVVLRRPPRNFLVWKFFEHGRLDKGTNDGRCRFWGLCQEWPGGKEERMVVRWMEVEEGHGLVTTSGGWPKESADGSGTPNGGWRCIFGAWSCEARGTNMDQHWGCRRKLNQREAVEVQDATRAHLWAPQQAAKWLGAHSLRTCACVALSISFSLGFDHSLSPPSKTPTTQPDT